MRLGVIGDAHLGCADYTERRRADFTTAFSNALDACMKFEVDVICLLGDVFDSALMRRNVDAFADVVREVAPSLELLRRAKVPLLAIAGNHEFGRGREAGELRVLESLGFVRVLRAEEFVIGGVGIIGFPWHAEHELPELPNRVRSVVKSSKAAQRFLMLHNFVKGSRHIPAHLAEIDERVAQGFDRVFVGHHHDAEELGSFVMPGATEVQNIAEAATRKSVVIHNTDTNKTEFVLLPKTRPTIVLRYDVEGYSSHRALLERLKVDLASAETTDAFVCVRVHGVAPIGGVVTRQEIHAVLREFNIFDRFIEVRVTSPTKGASDAVKGAKIEGLLRRDFRGSEKKARRYIDECTRPGFGETVVSEILK